MNKIISYLFYFLIPFGAFAQNDMTFELGFDWTKESFVEDIVTEKNADRLTFDGAHFSSKAPYVPIISKRFPVSAYGILRVEIIDVDFLDESPLSTFNIEELQDIIAPSIVQNIQFHTRVDENRKEHFGKIFFTPIVKSATNELLFVEKVTIRVNFKKKNIITQRTPPINKSVLSDGDIYKLEIAKTGMYKLTSDYLVNTLNININDINPDNIQIFNNPGGKIANFLMDERVDDLREISIFIKGDSDGSFDEGDAIYFYGEGPEAWETENINEYPTYNDNPFSNKNYAFIKIGSEKGLRITKKGQNSSDIETLNNYVHSVRYENNQFNLLEENFGTLGTGQEWFGELFDINKSQDFSSKIQISKPIDNAKAKVKMRFAGRSSSFHNVKINIGEQQFEDNINSTSLSSYTSDYAKFGLIDETFVLDTPNPNISIDYATNVNAEGWLDYIELHYERNLQSPGAQLSFSNINNNRNNSFNFVIDGVTSDHKVWNISEASASFEQNLVTTGNSVSFTCSNSTISKFVVFDESASLFVPQFVAKINNQNLHGIQSTDMVIITHSSLISEASRLKEHRKNNSDLSIILVDIDEVCNEFGGGKKDPSAVRDFLKMLYDRDPDFHYALLFGNGSFDYRGINHDAEKYNLIPVYETRSSVNAIRDFPCDDYFGLLSNQDGDDLRGEVDIALGRIPVNNESQARTVVDKIIRYETDPEMRGSWNLSTVFAADDEDGNAHINQADEIAEEFQDNHQDVNLSKIYWDAYNQVSTPGGERYPSVTSEINTTIFKGALTLCYLGHGGPSGWAQERVLQIKDIDNWTNERSNPLFITATCSLSSYDDPAVFSAGEKILVNKNGGIGLFTTCRAVYASDNKRLTESTFKYIVSKDSEGELYRLGEILRLAKNNEAQDTVDVNARKFLLLGDPSMKLLYPTYDVVTQEINNIDVINSSFTDTISALSQMKVKGYVADEGEKLNTFNGEIDVTIYDKETERVTLAQDTRSYKKTFMQQKNLIFKGKAEVVNGEFEFQFVVPKDILYNIGKGKISYYASNGNLDAKGSFTDFLVGGTSKNAISDDTPPIVQVYMNTEDFVSGGITNPNPVLYAKINDDVGINLSGSSVGHDLTATLNENTNETYLLNDFYESELNDYTSGIIQYPLSNLENGKHIISVRAWDVANNTGEGFTEFIVSDNIQDGLAHVLNYPNPFVNNTSFMFEHNFSPDVLDVEINIFSMSGRLVKTIEHSTVSDGFRVQDIKWDGTDDFGSDIGRGVYLYKIKVKALTQNKVKESGFEKLVILK